MRISAINNTQQAFGKFVTPNEESRELINHYLHNTKPEQRKV